MTSGEYKATAERLVLDVAQDKQRIERGDVQRLNDKMLLNVHRTVERHYLRHSWMGFHLHRLPGQDPSTAQQRMRVTVTVEDALRGTDMPYNVVT